MIGEGTGDILGLWAEWRGDGGREVLDGGINAWIRRAVNAGGHFPTGQAALNAFEITFNGRLSAGGK